MRVIYESTGQTAPPVTAVDIDAWQLQDVEVRREWQNIDLLLILSFTNQDQWIICIENKVNSAQSKGQLRGYRKKVEATFPDAKYRIYLFLTKNDETPDDDAYVSASYTQVHRSLKECLLSRSHVIGSEPKVLLDNYLRLLEEKFMDESEIARTAKKIYQQHRRALDVIFEQRPDNLKMISDDVRTRLEKGLKELGFVIDSYSKPNIRVIPNSWDHIGNTHGSGWGNSKRMLVFEMNLTGKRPSFYAICGKAPDEWIDPIWQRSAKAPFRRPKRAVRPAMWCTLHSSSSRVSLEDNKLTDPEAIAQKIHDWCIASLQEPETKEVIKIIADELPRLQKICAAQEA
jgi:hypothetical protein